MLFSVFWFCRNTFVESSNLQTKMSWSREFSSSGLQWTCRSAGGTSVISGGCYLALSSWMGMLLVSRSGVPSGKQCLISILSCFQVVVFLLLVFFCVFEVECPQQNTDALTLVATLMCHDLRSSHSVWLSKYGRCFYLRVNATCFSHTGAQINWNFKANRDRATHVVTCEPACLSMCKLLDGIEHTDRDEVSV